MGHSRIVASVARTGHAVVGGARAVWGAVGRLAEVLSDAGHGPNEPREEAGRDNPYAGHGPARPLRDHEDRGRE